MKERPILFSGEMVRAILDGRKTQTRRVVKPQPVETVVNLLWCPASRKFVDGKRRMEDLRKDLSTCPYGVAGDRLWAKETHWRYGRWVKNGKTKSGRQAWTFKPVAKEDTVLYVHGPKPRRTELGWHKRPSIFMPRWASRITLEITKVRVERLQDANDTSLICEGMGMYDGTHGPGIRIAKWKELWDKINGKGAWDKNPWVWVIEFRKL